MSPCMLCFGGSWQDTGQGGQPVLSSQLADALEAAPGKSGMGSYNRFGK